MPQASDSNYAAVTRHRRPFSTAGRPPVLEIVDDEWATDVLPDDDIALARHEAAVAPFMEEDELDADSIVVSASSTMTANSLSERRRREEGWNDLGLDQFEGRLDNATAGHHSRRQGNNGGTRQQQRS